MKRSLCLLLLLAVAAASPIDAKRRLLGKAFQSKASAACNLHNEQGTCLRPKPGAPGALPCTWCPTKSEGKKCQYNPMSCDEKVAAKCDLEYILEDLGNYFKIASGETPAFESKWPRQCTTSAYNLCHHSLYNQYTPQIEIPLKKFLGQAFEPKQVDADARCFMQLSIFHMKSVAKANPGDALGAVNKAIHEIYKILNKCDPKMQTWGRQGQVAQAAGILLGHFVGGAAVSVAAAATGGVPVWLSALSTAGTVASMGTSQDTVDKTALKDKARDFHATHGTAKTIGAGVVGTVATGALATGYLMTPKVMNTVAGSIGQAAWSGAINVAKGALSGPGPDTVVPENHFVAPESKTFDQWLDALPRDWKPLFRDCKDSIFAVNRMQQTFNNLATEAVVGGGK